MSLQGHYIVDKRQFYFRSHFILCSGFELIAIWSSRIVENSLEMAELENASCHDAVEWLLLPILTPNS